MALGKNLIKKKDSDSPSETTKEPLSKKYTASMDSSNGLFELFKQQQTNQTILEEEVEIKLLYVEIRVDSSYFTFPIQKVEEVVPLDGISTMPQAPKYLLGLANVRGEVYTILDLSYKFNLENEQTKAVPQYVLVIKHDTYKVAIALDEIPNTIEIKKSEIENIDGLSQVEDDKNFFNGIIKRNKKVIISLDIINLIEHIEVNHYS